MWKYIFGVSKVVNQKKNEKAPKAPRDTKEYEKTTAAPGPAQSLHEVDPMDVGEDTSATPGPAQPPHAS